MFIYPEKGTNGIQEEVLQQSSWSWLPSFTQPGSANPGGLPTCRLVQAKLFKSYRKLDLSATSYSLQNKNNSAPHMEFFSPWRQTEYLLYPTSTKNRFIPESFYSLRENEVGKNPFSPRLTCQTLYLLLLFIHGDFVTIQGFILLNKKFTNMTIEIKTIFNLGYSRFPLNLPPFFIFPHFLFSFWTMKYIIKAPSHKLAPFHTTMSVFSSLPLFIVKGEHGTTVNHLIYLTNNWDLNKEISLINSRNVMFNVEKSV